MTRNAKMLMSALAAMVLPGMAPGAVVFGDDFSTATAAGGDPANGATDPAKGWLTNGAIWLGSNDGVTGTGDIGQRLRGVAQMTRYFDLTSAVAAHGSTVKLTFNTWYRDNATGGEYGYVAYTTNGDGASHVDSTDPVVTWTVADTYSAADDPQANYGNTATAFTLDTSGWTAAQRANFGFGFQGQGQNNQDRFFIDNVELTVTPEPTALGLLALGAGMIGFRRRRA